MLTVAVVGANGFIGSRIVEVLHLRRLARVRPIVHSYSGLARVARFSLDWRIADAADKDSLVSALRGCDVLVHSVAGDLSTVTRSPSATYRASQAAGVRRIVYLSSASVHGQDIEPGTDEQSRLSSHQTYEYNNAKVLAERAFLRLWSRGRIQLVILRPCIVFGPRDNWISGIARKILDGSAYLVGGGNGFCNTIYVDNLVHAVNLALSADVDGEAFLVTDKEDITWNDLYGKVAVLLGCQKRISVVEPPTSFTVDLDAVERIKSIPVIRRSLDFLPKGLKTFVRRRLELLVELKKVKSHLAERQRANPWTYSHEQALEIPEEIAMLHRCRHRLSYAKAQRMLGYEPVVSLDDGLARTVAWLEFAGYPIPGHVGRKRDCAN